MSSLAATPIWVKLSYKAKIKKEQKDLNVFNILQMYEDMTVLKSSEKTQESM